MLELETTSNMEADGNINPTGEAQTEDEKQLLSDEESRRTRQPTNTYTL